MANFQKIKVIANEKNITLGELADRIGVTPTGLGLIIKSGKTMTDKLEAIAHVLGVKVSVFFDEDEQPATEATEPSDLKSIIEQKNAVIAQKDKIIEQKDELIAILMQRR